MVRRINLVPPGERRRTQSDVGLLILIVVVVAVLAAVGYAWFSYRTSLIEKENELAQVQSEIQKVQQQLNALAQYEALQTNKDQTEALVQEIYAGRTLLSEILGDISLVIPKQAWVQTMGLSAPEVAAVIATFAGKAPAAAGAAATGAPVGQFTVAGNTYTFEDVAGVMIRMQQVPSFINVTLGSVGPAGGNVDPAKKAKGFSLTAGVINTQAPDTPLPLTQVEVQASGGTKQ
jgi:Tfp pilus assembly protein PilN